MLNWRGSVKLDCLLELVRKYSMPRRNKNAQENKKLASTPPNQIIPSTQPSIMGATTLTNNLSTMTYPPNSSYWTTPHLSLQVTLSDDTTMVRNAADSMGSFDVVADAYSLTVGADRIPPNKTFVDHGPDGTVTLTFHGSATNLHVKISPSTWNSLMKQWIAESLSVGNPVEEAI